MRSIKLYYPNTRTGILEMKFHTGIPEQTSGVDLLLEKIVKLLLTKVGSNKFNPELGSIIGSRENLTINTDSARIEIIVHQAVEQVQEMILAEQSAVGLDKYSKNELLDSMQISNIVVSETDPTMVLAEVQVLTRGNQTYIVTV
jgi:hypothetical protein